MYLGIDFGTSNSNASYTDGTNIYPVNDSSTAHPSIPSAVFVTAQGEVLVGNVATYRRAQDPLAYRDQIKLFLGEDTPLILGKHSFRAEELIAHILVKIKQEGDRSIAAIDGSRFTSAVVTIPATYLEYRRKLMEQAAIVAGFTEKVDLLEEPVAAGIYHAYKNNFNHGEIVLVYDLGGGTFDVALLQMQSGTFTYCQNHLPDGLPDCGGAHFDQEIYRDLLKQHPELQMLLSSEHDDQFTIHTRIRLWKECVEIKHQLSAVEEATLNMPLALQGTMQIISYNLTRETFYMMIAPHIDRTIVFSQDLIQRAGLRAEQINHVLLVGGSCHIPYVRQRLEQTFHRPCIMAGDPTLIVSQGAALYGAHRDGMTSTLLPVKEAQEEQQNPEQPKERVMGDPRVQKNPWDILRGKKPKE